MLADGAILRLMGEKIKTVRLRQNITQKELSEQAGVHLSTLKRIEGGAGAHTDSLLRLLRTLGLLDHLQTLIDEEPISPSAYEKMLLQQRKAQRKRAVSHPRTNKEEEAATW